MWVNEVCVLQLFPPPRSAWLSSQPWSKGKVGMYGKSWGGFNGLQVASLRPPALAAVVSLYSTDNRFTDDVHYRGGCVVASQMLSWGSVMQVDFIMSNQQRNLNKLPTALRCRNFVNRHRPSICKSAPNLQRRVCNV